jgi:DNA mismatch repair protein MutL
VREAVVQAVSKALGASARITSGHVPMTSAAMAPTARTEAAKAPVAMQMPMPLPPARAFIELEQAPELIPQREQVSLRHDWSELPARAEAESKPDSPTSAPDPTAQWSTPAHDSSTPLPSASEISASPRHPVSASSTPSAADFRILGVIHKLYVLMESREGLVLMDQHAAHERVLFEQMRHAMEQEGVPAQRLLIPLTLQVAPRDYDLLSRNLPTLHKLGIEAEPFGGNAFKVDALPAFLKTDDPLALLRDVMDELSSASSRTSALRLGEDMIATTVCRHAVKANDYLREPELRKLLEDLLNCEMPYCCPHGRPTLIQMSLAELEKKFGRRAP